MEPKSPFANRTKYMVVSEVREILKLVSRPGIISFAGGLPAPESFPRKEVKEIVDHVLSDDKEAAGALQYGTTEGYVGLRKELAKRMRLKRSVDCDADEILVTAGSQQALDLLARVFLDPGDHVVTSQPTYLGAVTAIYASEARCATVQVDDQGEIPESLSRRLDELAKDKRPPKFVYVMSTFHNPLGISMGRKRRQDVYDICSERDLYIVEDDPYYELRYSGDYIPPIKSIDKDERVIYLSTFSKILTPGFRLGWVIAPKEVMRHLVVAKQASDLCTNTFGQFIATQYLKKGLVDPHMDEVRKIYGSRRKVMLESIEECFPKEAHWTKPDGGMFLWVTLPSEIDTREMLTRAVEQKVAYVSGRAFHVGGENGKNSMRLNFSYANEDDIRTGIQRLAAVIDAELKRKGAGEREEMPGLF
ncbi:MAG TPA: PLP-dependent aminotransferase family protein [Thermoplasmata archaeon]|nr:PLP-dependent aminotransferase family protein [Thermoplasmata archaeon]